MSRINTNDTKENDYLIFVTFVFIVSFVVYSLATADYSTTVCVSLCVSLL